MKPTGIVRRLDELGRIVLPMELRKTLNIAPKDSMEIFVEDDRIILKKYEASCVFCENASSLIEYEGKKICRECVGKINIRL